MVEHAGVFRLRSSAMDNVDGVMETGGITR